MQDSVPRRHSCPTIAAAYRLFETTSFVVSGFSRTQKAASHVIMERVILDRHQRPLRNLRLSVTDRCNLRCSYCMPEPDYVWLPREDILQFEEIETLVDVFTSLGVDKVRLTGGEPLLRRDLPELIQKLAARPAIRDLGADGAPGRGALRPSPRPAPHPAR